MPPRFTFDSHHLDLPHMRDRPPMVTKWRFSSEKLGALKLFHSDGYPTQLSITTTTDIESTQGQHG